ncbi:MAG: sensor domain-containing diguanylate cyclase [candidate division Zixibacteria bacterium]|nr:sensor domain-containing diguanylate cyclase [candidate division Zixibacteria bacterium]
MKLFLDRNKTLLPRIDVVVLLTRILTFASVCWFAVFGTYEQSDNVLIYALISSYTMLIMMFSAGMMGKFDLKLAYLGTIIYDLIFLPLFVLYTGGMDSSLYLFFYLTVSVAAYVLVFPVAATIVVILTASYIGLVMHQLTVDNLFGFSIRIGLLWIYFLALSYVSEYMHKSERRLMKLFNTLNMRTSELEKSQAQLEMTYENTRVLASFMEPDDVVREVMRIMGNTLGYSSYMMILRNRQGEYYYRARCMVSRTSYSLRPLDISRNELLTRVANGQEAIRINDLTSRDDYQTLSKDSKSALIVPMAFHNYASGLLVAESNETQSFSERDEQLLIVVARSAGLAMENAELLRRTEELSIIDELTNSYNYRFFVQKFQEEKKRAVRYNLPLSIIMIDIDWFKKLNDSFGHEIGNIVLKQLASVVEKCIRDVDIFARYGGEEFVVILPQTPLSEAQVIGERIRSQVEAMIIDTVTKGTVQITVSIGVSSYPENGRSEEELVTVADQALYRAKDSGKNLVCVS